MSERVTSEAPAEGSPADEPESQREDTRQSSSGGERASASPTRPPVSLGRHRLLFPIGHGGMSDVYLALVSSGDGVNKLLVAKLLRAAMLDDPHAQSMFMDEARLAARLHHVNVVQTFEVGQQGPLPYMTMEFLDGQPLHRIVRRLADSDDADWRSSVLTLGMRLRIIIEMLEGLHYAHELRDYDGTPLAIVHRDVSPQNLFCTYDGQIKLVDFGIAKASASTTHTEGRGLEGKLAYMAPEQAAGEPVDRRADVFAVGVMLWELLAGRRLWSGRSDATVARELVDRELPPLDIDGLAPELAEICATALAPALDDRYPSAEAMREALERYVQAATLAEHPRAIGRVVAELFAREREETRARIDFEIRWQLEGTGETEQPPSLWRDGYRGEPRESTLLSGGSEPGDSSVPDEITADYGPKQETVSPPTQSSSELGVAEPPRHRRRWWPVAAVLGLAGLIAIPALRQPAREASDEPAPKPKSDMGGIAPAPAPSPEQQRDACELPVAAKPTVTLSGELDDDATLHCDRNYLLTFNTHVNAGATLTIEPGTTILGDRETKGTLIIEPGARLLAEGTPSRPIVFTSAQPEHARKPGDWGGVLLLGRAPINLRDAEGQPLRGRVEGLAAEHHYGGDDPNDDSGVLRYVRIEYPGVELAPANEINGLTLAGVGRGTVIDHVQVRASSDDCFEFFGGTVDAKHLVCDAPGDDALDVDQGYQGRLQYVVIRDVPLPDEGPQPSNGLELDNDPTDALAEPRTRPVLWNVTMCGLAEQRSPGYGVLIRRGAQAELHAALIGGFDFALDVRDAGTELQLRGLALLEQAPAEPGEPDDDAGFDEQAWLTSPERVLFDDLDGRVACRPGSVDFVPAAPIVAPNLPSPPDDGFFDASARYLGAIEDAEHDWTREWVVWTP